MTDFAGHPLSLTEHKATKERDGSLWTVRDVLIAVLRDIDEGTLAPDNIVVLMSTKAEDGVTAYHHANKARDSQELVGLITIGLNDIIAGR